MPRNSISCCVRLIALLAIVAMLFIIFVANPDYSENLVISQVLSQNYIEHHHTYVPQQSDTKDPSIHGTERNHHNFKLTGWMFKDTGRSHYIADDITSCMIHSFSPHVEREAAKRFLDPARDNLYLANSPAVTWFKGQLVLVSRVWLVREKYEAKNDWPANHFADNWFYTQKFDRHLKPINNGSIMGIPSPKQWWVGDGPIEPRVVTVKDKLFVTFNAAMAFGHKKFMDYTIMWDYEENRPIIPRIKGGSPMLNASEKDDMPRDKHWMALVQNNDLYFVHNLDPLRVMHCDLTGYCEFVHYETNKEGFIFEHHVSHLRGGTPFELYEWPYYISVAHTTLYKDSNHHRYYTANIVVMSVDPYRIVYVSDALQIHPDIYQESPMVRAQYIDDGFIFPVGIVLESPDLLTIGVHVNDYCSVLLRFRGIQKLMRTIIDKDKQTGTDHGPPVGYLQKHVHDAQENITHMGFVH